MPACDPTSEPSPRPPRADRGRAGRRCGAARASGTRGVVVTTKDETWSATDTCDSTELSWSARSSKGAKVKRAKPEIRVGAAARGHMGTS